MADIINSRILEAKSVISKFPNDEHNFEILNESGKVIIISLLLIILI